MHVNSQHRHDTVCSKKANCHYRRLHQGPQQFTSAHFTDEETEPHTFASDRPWVRTGVASLRDRGTSLLPEAFLHAVSSPSRPLSSEHCSGLPGPAAHLFPEGGSAQILSAWDIQLYLPSEARSLPFPAGTPRLQSDLRCEVAWGSRDRRCGGGGGGGRWRRRRGHPGQSARTPGGAGRCV